MASAEEAVQGDVVGMIIPPPTVRAKMEKTAAFVARNGAEFEARIRASDADGTRFSFLRENDVYHPYYVKRVEELRREHEQESEGDNGVAANGSAAAKETPSEQQPGREEEEKEAADEGNHKQATYVRTAVLNPLQEARKRMPKGEKPPAPEFRLVHPTHLSAMDWEVIKLTAQHTAVSGRKFLSSLTTKEYRNPQFAFLQPQHPLFEYFTQLVDSYAKVLRPPRELRERLVTIQRDAQPVLDRSVHRFEWEREEEERRRVANADVDANRLAFRTIDWHDFVVVDTIELMDNEDLPAPLDFSKLTISTGTGPVAPASQETARTLASVTSAAGQHDGPRAAEHAGQRQAPVEDDGEKEEDEDEDDDMEVEDMEVEETGGAATGGAQPAAQVHTAEEEDDEPIVVRQEHRPRVVPHQQSASGGASMPTHFVDPRTGRQVPVADVSDHLRIELMDPSYMESVRRSQAKHSETALAADTDIGANLKRLAQHRADIFGGEESESERRIEEERQRAREKVTWDGSVTSMSTIREAKKQEVSSKATGSAAPEDEAQSLRRPGPQVGPGAEEPAAKRRRVERAFLPVDVTVPSDPNRPEWGLRGQTLSLSTPAEAPVSALKAQLQSLLGGLQPSQMQLRREGGGGAEGHLSDDVALSDLTGESGQRLRLQLEPVSTGYFS